MRRLTEFPNVPRARRTPPVREKKTGLRLPQIRVLQVLAEAAGPLTRAKISERCGNKTQVVVGRAVGYSDPERRRIFEETTDGGGSPGRPCFSLLTLEHVREFTLDVDGVEELVVEITPKGRQALMEEIERMGTDELPPLRD